MQLVAELTTPAMEVALKANASKLLDIKEKELEKLFEMHIQAPHKAHAEHKLAKITKSLGKVSSDELGMLYLCYVSLPTEQTMTKEKIRLPVQLIRKANDICLDYNNMIAKKDKIMEEWAKKADVFVAKVEKSYPEVWNKIQALRSTFGDNLKQILSPRELMFGILLREGQVGDELVQPLKEILLKLNVQHLEEYVKLAEEVEATHHFSFEYNVRYSLQFKSVRLNTKLDSEEAAMEEAIKTAERLTKELITGLKSIIERIKKAQEKNEINSGLLNNEIDEVIQTINLRETVERLASQLYVVLLAR